ncbi:MAG: histidine kinase, partial [Leptospiraceae bacterium]|nr:histidine kinase [Leptospiraceae bacterium]
MNQSLLGILFVGPAGTIEWTPSRVNALNEVRSLVTMALSNSILYARLEGILEHLEEKVKERTRKLEEAQSHLVQSEKMAMLGVMIAGIAHEINTPAGVIFGGSMNLQKNLEAALDLMPSLLDQLGEQTIRSLMQLSMEQSRRRIHVTGAFKKKRELASQLESWIGPSQWITSLSEHLVETGL